MNPRRFYEAMGAHVVGKRACDYGSLEGWTLTYLEKELKTEANTTSDVTRGPGLSRDWGAPKSDAVADGPTLAVNREIDPAGRPVYKCHCS